MMRKFFRKKRSFDTFRDIDSRGSISKNVLGLGVLLVGLVGLLVLFFGFRLYVAAPGEFPTYETVRVESGETLASISQKLRDRSFVKSAQVFEWSVLARDGERNVVAGSYYFERPLSTLELAERFTSGDFGFERTSVTFPEGTTVEEMGTILEENFPLFSRERFVTLGRNREGYLFPETYRFFPDVTASTVISQMSDEFQQKTADLRERIERSPRSLSDVVIMASILEEEGMTTEDRRRIAGILWKRLDEGMRLQVDATFLYFTDKNTFELTREDLQIDSLYNTYRYEGLPVGPITNPGLDSLEAAMNPIESPYWYYLSDLESNVYYSETLEQHEALRRQYLEQ